MPKLAFQAVLVILSHDPFDPRSLRQWRLHKNSNFGTTTRYHGLKVVPSIDCAENKKFPLRSSFVLLSGGCFVDLTLHVRRQPPCGGSVGFACLGSHPGLANCTGASIEGVIVARCTGCSSKLCLSFGPFEPRSLQQRRDSYQLSLCQMVLNRDCAVQKSEAVKL